MSDELVRVINAVANVWVALAVSGPIPYLLIRLRRTERQLDAHRAADTFRSAQRQEDA